MAEYLVLIYENEADWAGVGDDDSKRILDEHRTFGERNAQVLRGGNALHGTDTATSIRRDAAGAPVITDGAFAETKEALGGYYLIEAASLDEAIAVAKQVPAPFGGVEVRPVRTFD
ncbi:MAG TPA: YciI family protein [Pseudonocardia sp.]|nr:YciI family protein [Pseudonocardia sp.]